jgi:DNA-binding phage protein
MALTREFKDTVMELCKDPEYRRGLLLEALESYLEGDIVVGNSLLRDYLNGTQAFGDVAKDLQMQEAGLRRMVSPSGNATAKNIFRLFKVCQDREGIHSVDEFLSHVA